MHQDLEQRIDGFVDAAHKAAAQGLVRCSSGNLSSRLDAESMLATVSRSWMERLTADDVTRCRIADGQSLDGKRPTVEMAFHAAILNARPEVNVVLHFQSPAATALACSQVRDTNFFVIPEIPFYIGHVTVVPYCPPGSTALASEVATALMSSDLAILSNHGQVTVARDFDHAIQNAVFFELACDVLLRTGEHVRPIPDAHVRQLFEARAGGGA